MGAANQVTDGVVQNEGLAPVHLRGGRCVVDLLQFDCPWFFQDKQLVMRRDCLHRDFVSFANWYFL
jgi:hypothetical protein